MPTWEDLRNTTVESGWKMLSSAAQSFGTPIAKSLANIGALGATGWGAIQMARNKPESAQKAFDKALAARQYAGTEGSFDQGFKSGGKTLLQGALSSGQTALTGLGLPHLTAGKLATAGVIGGGFNKVMGGDFSTGAGQAMGSLPQILGFVAQTNPLLAKYLPKNTQLNEKVVGSLGNVGQGIAMDLARGMKPTVGGMLLDAATGYSPLSQFDMPKTKLNPDVWTSDKSILNEAKQKLRVGIDISENTALTKNLDNMYKQYGLASYPGWKNLTDGEKVDILDNRLTEMVKEFGSVKMGIVGDQSTRELYHVTDTKNIGNIKEKGLLQNQPSNWVKQADKTKYGNGEVYAFENYDDAVKWAGKMDWENYRKTGSGNISIVKLKDNGKWVIDSNDPLSQAEQSGKWLKQSANIDPKDISESIPITNKEIKALIEKQNAQFAPPIKTGGEYLYHGTPAKNLESILKGGLNTGLAGKVGFSNIDAKSALDWSENVHQGQSAIVLRLKKGTIKPDLTDGGEEFFNNTIPPELLEVSQDGGKTWKPLSSPIKTGGDFNIKSFINNKLPKQLSNKLSLISTNRQKIFADSIKVVDIYEDIARQKLTGQKKYDAIDNVLKEFSKNQSNRTKDWVQMILDKQGADKVIAFDNFINRIHEGGGNILSYDLNDFVSLNEDQTILDDFANYIKKRLDDLAK